MTSGFIGRFSQRKINILGGKKWGGGGDLLNILKIPFFFPLIKGKKKTPKHPTLHLCGVFSMPPAAFQDV
jgi:hypothetical protein